MKNPLTGVPGPAQIAFMSSRNFISVTALGRLHVP
jgi:hypothetical protein